MKLDWKPGTNAGAFVALGRLNSYIVEPRRKGGVEIWHGHFCLGRAATVDEGKRLAQANEDMRKSKFDKLFERSSL